MLIPVLTEDKLPLLTAACGFEHVFGSKILTAARAYGLTDPRASFWVQAEGGCPTAALYLNNHVLVISASEHSAPEEIAALVREKDMKEVDTNWDQCACLQQILGGVTESSYYMAYPGEAFPETFPDIQEGDLRQVFQVLQRSHEYYRTHFRFETWSDDLKQKLDRGLMELYQLEAEGEVVGTGSIISEDEDCGVLAAVAVVPEHRHKGLGSRISRFLVNRIREKGKTPRLISGYDAVAELYRQVGFETRGRWGELYL